MHSRPCHRELNPTRVVPPSVLAPTGDFESSRLPAPVVGRSACRLLVSAALCALSSVFQLAGVGSIAAAAPSAEQNWPQWRGPLASGVAPAANPPVTWSEQSNMKWKVKLPGSGSATPIVWE